MARFRVADLYCCAGGAGLGLRNAGAIVVGFDIEPQPHYLGHEFRQCDVLQLDPRALRREFDFIWASPPCQAHTALKTMHNAKKHPNLIPQTRSLLEATGLPYVIENVEGAKSHLRSPFKLCGSMFDLGVQDAELRRHRLFETNFPVSEMKCNHGRRARTIGIYGEGFRDSRRKFDKGVPDFSKRDGEAAMQIPTDAMTVGELSQAIPPAYSKWIFNEWRRSRK
jgi:DNA (cytosine-5)-methyltransferase 1